MRSQFKDSHFSHTFSGSYLTLILFEYHSQDVHVIHILYGYFLVSSSYLELIYKNTLLISFMLSSKISFKTLLLCKYRWRDTPIFFQKLSNILFKYMPEILNHHQVFRIIWRIPQNTQEFRSYWKSTQRIYTFLRISSRNLSIILISFTDSHHIYIFFRNILESSSH